MVLLYRNFNSPNSVNWIYVDCLQLEQVTAVKLYVVLNIRR